MHVLVSLFYGTVFWLRRFVCGFALRMPRRLWALCGGCLFALLPVLGGFSVTQAQPAGLGLEILQLRHRPAAEVLPVLQPLLEPGASLSGSGYQLFLRTSGPNRAEIRAVLATLDVPVRRLLIHVTTDAEEVARQRGAALSGSVGNDRVRVIAGTGPQQPGQVSARVYDSRSVGRSGGSQRVQTVEGGRAFIQVGESIALPMRQVVLDPHGRLMVQQGVEYRDIGQGFYAEPRLRGDLVTIEISQQDERLSRQSGRQPGLAPVQVQRLSTTVSGRLGEWLQLGGVGAEVEGHQRGGLSLSTDAVRSERGVWLLVEELP